VSFPDDAAAWAELDPETFGEHFRYVYSHNPAKIPALLRLRFRHRKDEFLKYCWPERFGLPFNDMHRHLFEVSDVLPWHERPKPDLLDAVAAPRGMGKSSIASFGDVVHAIVYDVEAFIVLISSGRDLVWDLSIDLLNQFKPLPDGSKDLRPLTRLYGPFRTNGGKMQWQVSVRGRPEIALTTKSFGQDIRGIKHPTRGIRPTLVILDDAEKKDRVRNPEQRALWESTLSKDILKLSGRESGTAFRFVGTILHTDSILSRRLKDPGWRSEKYAAILQWPSERAQGFWEKCRSIWADLSLGPQRRRKALEYYEKRRPIMEEEVELLDPVGMPLFTLYELIWSQGLASFLQEMQNDPVDPTVAIFHSPRFSYFSVQTNDKGERFLVVEGERPRVVAEDDLVYKVLHWDPSEGSVAGDYAAIALVARDIHGYKYVLACWMARRPPSAQRDALWSMAEMWNVRRARIESNGFQDLAAEPYERERDQRRLDGRYWQLEIEHKAASTSKDERIASLEPEVSNGWILFNRALSKEVLAQFDMFPGGDHDDGPDAIQAACAQLGYAGGVGMRS